MKTLSRHLLLELYACDLAVLDDVDAVRRAMLAATEAIGATLLSETFHRFEPQGVSGVVVIGESHLAVHTWPEAAYAAVDVFTCGDLDPKGVIAVLQAHLGAGEARTLEVLRGLPEEVGATGPLRPGQVRIQAGGVDLAPDALS